MLVPSTVDTTMSPVSVTAFSNTTSPPSVVIASVSVMPDGAVIDTAVPFVAEATILPRVIAEASATDSRPVSADRVPIVLGPVSVH